MVKIARFLSTLLTAVALALLVGSLLLVGLPVELVSGVSPPVTAVAVLPVVATALALSILCRYWHMRYLNSNRQRKRDGTIGAGLHALAIPGWFPGRYGTAYPLLE